MLRCSFMLQLSWSGSLQLLKRAGGLALLFIPLASPPCLQPPVPKPLQVAPGSPEPLWSRVRPLTWQKAAFFSSFPSRVGSTVAQGRIRWGWGALEDGHCSPSAAASWHLPPEAAECNFALKQQFLKTLLKLRDSP